MRCRVTVIFMRSLSLALMACLPLAACGGGLPHDHGVNWDCIGVAHDCLDDGTGCFPLAQIGPGPGAVHVSECADPGTDGVAIQSACASDCESQFRAYGLFSRPPFIWRDIHDCTIVFVASTGAACHASPVEFYNGGPAERRLLVDHAATTASLTVDGHPGSTHAGGTIDVTIGQCTGAVCAIRISRMEIIADDFAIGGKAISGVGIQNRQAAVGTWASGDGTFELPAGALTVGTNFRVDSAAASTTLSNTLSALVGHVERNGSTFRLTGSFSSGSTQLAIDVTAHAVENPPVAILSPLGSFECDSPAGARVTFSSAASSDPDNDIRSRAWTINGSRRSFDTDFTVQLPFGATRVGLGVMDSRGATDNVEETVTVTDTRSPSLSVGLDPPCLWPPNHRMVLYGVGSGITLSADDTCGAVQTTIVSVVSDQPSTGGGSGNTSPDVVFGSHAFCVRGERAGTIGAARVYTVTFEATDRMGNSTRRSATIEVPHDRGHATAACGDPDPTRIVDDGDPRCSR